VAKQETEKCNLFIGLALYLSSYPPKAVCSPPQGFDDSAICISWPARVNAYNNLVTVTKKKVRAIKWWPLCSTPACFNLGFGLRPLAFDPNLPTVRRSWWMLINSSRNLEFFLPPILRIFSFFKILHAACLSAGCGCDKRRGSCDVDRRCKVTRRLPLY